MEHAVEWGLAHRDLSGLTAVGVDEIAWSRGHRYLTLVYDIGGGARRLLAVAEERTEASLRSCLDGLGETACKRGAVRVQRHVAAVPQCDRARDWADAIHVLDRFHVMQQFGKALDEIRAEEAKRLKRDGYEPVLKRSRWCLLKRPENLTDKQTVKLSELLKYNLRTVRAYLLREEFQRLWEYKSACVGGEVPGRMDGPGDAIAAGADEEGRPDDPDSSAADPELVPGQGRGLGGGRGGAQQQGETGDEKVVRFPDAPKWRNWLYCTTSATFPSRNAPTDSAEEAKIKVSGREAGPSWESSRGQDRRNPRPPFLPGRYQSGRAVSNLLDASIHRGDHSWTGVDAHFSPHAC